MSLFGKKSPGKMLDALTAKDARMLTTVEVFDSLIVLLAQVRLYVLVLGQVLRLQALVKVNGGEEGILSDDLVQNVEI